MNRRQFLTRALAAVPGIVAGEQLLELLAPTRTIFLPPRTRWMGIDWASGPDRTVWAIKHEGGYFYSEELSDVLREGLISPVTWPSGREFTPQPNSIADRRLLAKVLDRLARTPPRSTVPP